MGHPLPRGRMVQQGVDPAIEHREGWRVILGKVCGPADAFADG